MIAPAGRGAVVTVGTFDGVHLGHRAVLEANARRAAESALRSVLVTFEPHPLEVVNPEAAPPRLTVANERLEALASCPVDQLLILRFDREMARLDPAEFVDAVLLARCDMRALVIGYDHGFGRGRSGDLDTLRQLGARHGFPVEVVGPVTVGDVPVSSTAIRRAVAGGDLDGAAALLGRRYSVAGTVRRGEQRGRTIGFPTVNLAPPRRKLLPPDGVYAVTVDTPAGRFGGMMNQGHRPTFGDGRRLLEVHLFGFEGELYHRTVRIEWVAPLRDIRRFPSVAALQQQLDDDRRQATAVLAAAHLHLDAPVTAPE